MYHWRATHRCDAKCILGEACGAAIDLELQTVSLYT